MRTQDLFIYSELNYGINRRNGIHISMAFETSRREKETMICALNAYNRVLCNKGTEVHVLMIKWRWINCFTQEQGQSIQQAFTKSLSTQFPLQDLHQFRAMGTKQWEHLLVTVSLQDWYTIK